MRRQREQEAESEAAFQATPLEEKPPIWGPETLCDKRDPGPEDPSPRVLEIEAHLQQIFNVLDRDGNGYCSVTLECAVMPAWSGLV